MMMKADDLEKYADLMVESFNKALELREASLLKRIAFLEARELVAGPPGKDGREGVDGKDGTPGRDADEEAIYVKTAAYAASYIREKVAELPKPKDGLNGKDAEPINKDALVGEILSKIVVPAGKDGENGINGKDATPIDTDAVIKAIVAQIPVPANGKDGAPGKDAEPINTKALVAEVVALVPIPTNGKDGRDGLNGKDASQVDVKVLAENLETAVMQKVLAAIPAPIHGKDGLTIKGDPGEPGIQGPAGINGKDAPPVDTKALTEEVVQKVLPLIPPPIPGRDGIAGADGANGLNGKDGRDGYSLKDFSCEPLDDGRTIRLKFIGQDHEVVEELTLPIPVYRDVYQRENREMYQKHDWLTYGNETWAVLVDKPTSDPGMDRGEWQLVARKGRDGRDRDRAKDHNGPVKL